MKRLTRDQMINQVKTTLNRKSFHLRFDSTSDTEDASYWLTQFNLKLNVYFEMSLITYSTFKRYKKLLDRLFFVDNVNLK